jgi:3-oxoacyl-[acyl-carrier protein] reductase
VDVRGKTILVTGAGRGIGRSLARHFAGKGAKLALLDMNAQDVEATQAQCTQVGAVARSYVADAANEDNVVGALDQVTADFGRLDGLINNAGIVRDALLVKVKDGRVIGKMTLEEWQAVIDTNLTGVFLCAREAAQRMISQSVRGVIVNVSSISRAGNAGQTNYSAAKAGLIGLTKAAAKEGARYGIRVNAIQPGFIRTAMTDAMPQDVLNSRVAEIPLGRMGEPRDVANTALFLASDLASYLTGITIEVSGGRNM